MPDENRHQRRTHPNSGHEVHDGTEKKDINFNQVNCYPINGWMHKHNDTKKRGVLLNCMFPITLKNTHYDSGGLFIYHKNKIRHRR